MKEWSLNNLRVDLVSWRQRTFHRTQMPFSFPIPGLLSVITYLVPCSPTTSLKAESSLSLFFVAHLISTRRYLEQVSLIPWSVMARLDLSEFLATSLGSFFRNSFFGGTELTVGSLGRLRVSGVVWYPSLTKFACLSPPSSPSRSSRPWWPARQGSIPAIQGNFRGAAYQSPSSLKLYSC